MKNLFAVLLVGIVTSVLVSSCGSEPSGGGGNNEAQLDSASGRIVRVDLDTRRFVLKPQGEEAMVFIFNPESLQPTLDGEEVEPDAIAADQRAEVEYLVNDKDRNVARALELRPAPSSEGNSNNEETSTVEETT